MHEVTCLECSRTVGETWFRHECFTQAPRNVWRTPDSGRKPVGRPMVVADAAVPATNATVRPMWNSSLASFKSMPIAAAASVGLRMGYTSFAVPSCGTAAYALHSWCLAHRVAAELWLPNAAATPENLCNANVIRTGMSWHATHDAFWTRCGSADDIYPLFPSGDPWFLAALETEAEQILAAGYERIVLPCGSGVHLLAFLEACERTSASTELVGVQLCGHDPLVSAWIGNAPHQPAGTRCPIPSMSSESPVNCERITELVNRVPGAKLVAVGHTELARAAAKHGPWLAERCRWHVDPSLYACLAVCAREPRDTQPHTCVLSTAGRQLLKPE
jgi:hypothetical protein